MIPYKRKAKGLVKKVKDWLGGHLVFVNKENLLKSVNGRRALTVGEVLYQYIKDGTIDQIWDRYEAIYIPYEYLSPFFPSLESEIMEKLLYWQIQGRIIVLNLYDSKKLEDDYREFIEKRANKEEIEPPTPTEVFTESKLAPLLYWANKLEAELILPHKTPFVELSKSLKEMDQVIDEREH